MALVQDIEGLYSQDLDNLRKWYANARKETSMDGEMATAASNEQQETFHRANQIADSVAGVTGDENAAAKLKKANADAFAQAQRQLAGTMAQQRMAVERDYFQGQQTALKERIARKQQQQQNIANAVGGLVQAGLQVAGTAIGGPAGGLAAKAVTTAAKSAIDANKPQFADPYDVGQDNEPKQYYA